MTTKRHTPCVTKCTPPPSHSATDDTIFWGTTGLAGRKEIDVGDGSKTYKRRLLGTLGIEE